MYNKKIFKRCFNWKGKQWYRNLKEIPLYFRLMHFLLRHGYDEYATWETFSWFCDVMTEILTHYRNERTGTPQIAEAPGLDPFSDAYDELNEKQWNATLDEMLEMLEVMKEEDCEDEELRDVAKNRFFELFSKYFYHFWD